MNTPSHVLYGGISGPTCIDITLPYPPSVNHLYATFRGRRILSREGRAYKQHVALIVAKVKPLEGELQMTVRVYRPERRGDLSNRLKALEDSMAGFAFKNDSQIGKLDVERYLDHDRPRVEVTIAPWSSRATAAEGAR